MGTARAFIGMTKTTIDETILERAPCDSQRPGKILGS
jgi:hypothetical protein